MNIQKMRKTAHAALMLVVAAAYVLTIAACDNDTSLKNLTGTVSIVLPAGMNPNAVPLGTELTAEYDGRETVTFQWNKGGESIQWEIHETFEPYAEGVYTVTVGAAGFHSKTSSAVTVIGNSNLASMTFENDPEENPADPVKSFTIFDDLTFNVVFLDLGNNPAMQDALGDLGVEVGTEVWGSIRQTSDTWMSDVINGVAEDMGSNSAMIQFMFDLEDITMGIRMTYTKSAGGDITEALIEFPDDDVFAEISTMLMGGTYYRVVD